MQLFPFHLITYAFLLAFASQPVAGQSLLSSTIAGDRLDVDIYGNMFVASGDRNTVRLFSKDTVLLREIGGSGWENDQFDHPAGIWARNGIDVFVADFGNHRVQRFDRSLNYVATYSTHESQNPDERFGYPTDVALSRLGDLFICDTENTRIVKVNRFTKVERVFGGFDAGTGRLRRPTQLEIGPQDYVYVLDGNRVLVFDTFGNFLHDLAAGVFKNPGCLYADNEGVVVLDDTVIYFFDLNERPVASILLQSLLSVPHSEILSIAFTKTTMYLLTSVGLFTLPSPRPESG